MPVSIAENRDNMEAMRNTSDKFWDLAIVDPPYGIGQNWNKDRKSRFYGHKNDFNNTLPGQDYFNELFRVSKNQIVWGMNYYWNFLPTGNNIIFWDKGKDAFSQFGSAGELAWTSIKKYPLVKVDLMWNGCCVCEPKDKAFHPHQKPVSLYKWLLKHYAKPGDKIVDTHLGSGSSRIAALDMGFDFWGYELDRDYFFNQEKRFSEHIKKPELFSAKETYHNQLQINF